MGVRICVCVYVNLSMAYIFLYVHTHSIWVKVIIIISLSLSLCNSISLSFCIVLSPFHLVNSRCSLFCFLIIYRKTNSTELFHSCKFIYLTLKQKKRNYMKCMTIERISSALRLRFSKQWYFSQFLSNDIFLILFHKNINGSKVVDGK